MSDEEVAKMVEDHEKEVQELDEVLWEQHEKEEEEEKKAKAESRIGEIFEELKKTQEKTWNDNHNNVIKVNYRMNRFIEAASRYIHKPDKRTNAFTLKYSEIVDSACDSFFLGVVGRYKTANILMRKMLELFAVANYIDMSGTSDSQEVLDWMLVSGRYKKGMKEVFKTIDPERTDPEDETSLYNIYSKLCKFIHNEGTEEYMWAFSSYDKKAFDTYTKDMVLLSDRLCDLIEEKMKKMKSSSDQE